MGGNIFGKLSSVVCMIYTCREKGQHWQLFPFRPSTPTFTVLGPIMNSAWSRGTFSRHRSPTERVWVWGGQMLNEDENWSLEINSSLAVCYICDDKRVIIGPFHTSPFSLGKITVSLPNARPCWSIHPKSVYWRLHNAIIFSITASILLILKTHHPWMLRKIASIHHES